MAMCVATLQLKKAKKKLIMDVKTNQCYQTFGKHTVTVNPKWSLK